MGDINLTKKLKNRKTGNILSTDEVLNKWGKQGIHHFYKTISSEYILLDNTYEELDESIQKLLENDK